MEITLRPLQSGDEAFLYRLYCSVREDELTALNMDAAAKETFLQMQFRAQQIHYQTHRIYAEYNLIFCDADQPVGQWFVDRESEEHNLHLLDISLLSEYRNRKIGTYLIQQLVDEADTEGKTISLYVHTDSAAIHLYRRFGFESVAVTGLYYFMQRPTRCSVSY